MNKKVGYIVITILVIVLIVLLSYFMYTLGITEKIKGSIEGYTAIVDNNKTIDELPIIQSVINSSGNEYTNSDIEILITAKSNSNLDRIEYSYDLKKWNLVAKQINKKTFVGKIVFKETINKDIYIRCVNKKGYKSYAYKTSILIDKIDPVIKKEGNILNISDNTKLAYIQYSNDNINWEDLEVNNKSKIIFIHNIKYKYVRAVDLVGNISNVVKINK